MSEDFSYPTVLAALSGHTVINARISGELSSQGLVRLPSMLDKHRPDMIILREGGNDILIPITYGKGVSEDFSYPTVLAALSGHTVINAGIPGELSSQGLVRLPKVLEQHRPDTIILLEGGNDILGNKKPSQTKHNLGLMIQLAQSQGIELLLIGVPANTLFSTSAAFYQELATEYDVVFDDSIVADLLKTPRLKSDAVHFNELGYQTLATHIFERLQENGALSL